MAPKTWTAALRSTLKDYAGAYEDEGSREKLQVALERIQVRTRCP